MKREEKKVQSFFSRSILQILHQLKTGDSFVGDLFFIVQLLSNIRPKIKCNYSIWIGDIVFGISKFSAYQPNQMVLIFGNFKVIFFF